MKYISANFNIAIKAQDIYKNSNKSSSDTTSHYYVSKYVALCKVFQSLLIKFIIIC